MMSGLRFSGQSRMLATEKFIPPIVTMLESELEGIITYQIIEQ